MILNNFFAARQPQASAVGFAERGEGLEQLPGDFRRNARSGIFKFGDDLAGRRAKAQNDPPSAGHCIGGVMNQIKKQTTQPLRVQWQGDGRRRVFHIDGCRSYRRLPPQLLEDILHKPRIINRRQHQIRRRALGEVQDLADQLVDALDLLANGLEGLIA